MLIKTKFVVPLAGTYFMLFALFEPVPVDCTPLRFPILLSTVSVTLFILMICNDPETEVNCTTRCQWITLLVFTLATFVYNVWTLASVSSCLFNNTPVMSFADLYCTVICGYVVGMWVKLFACSEPRILSDLASYETNQI